MVSRHDRVDGFGNEVTDGLDDGPDEVPRHAVGVVSALLTLLLVPALIGFDAWPLTAWRLYSVSRTDTQTRYRVEVTTTGGGTEVIELIDLPLGHRNAAWALPGLQDAPPGRRQEVCQALLEGARDVVDDPVGLTIVRVHERAVEDDGRWRVRIDEREVLDQCNA
jgi:hypothetical protein